MQNNTIKGINEARITIQGDGRIYANGTMQAVVTVICELDEATEISSLELRKMYSGELITDLGYVISQEDNGFQHEITESKSVAVTSSPQVRNTVTRTFYISTEERTSIDIGFVLTTSDGDEWSTIDGTPVGSVRLTPLTPVTYSGKDFERRYLTHYFDGGVINVTIMGVHNKSNPSLSYPVITGLTESQGGILSIDTENAALRDYSRDNSSSNGEFNWAGGYLTPADLQIFSFIESVDPHDQVDLAVPLNNAALITVSKCSQDKFFAGDYICNLEFGPEDGDDVYYCGQYSRAGMSDFAVDEDHINPLVNDIAREAQVMMTDHYGTTYPLRFLTHVNGITIPGGGRVYGVVIDGEGT